MGKRIQKKKKGNPIYEKPELAFQKQELVAGYGQKMANELSILGTEQDASIIPKKAQIEFEDAEVHSPDQD